MFTNREALPVPSPHQSNPGRHAAIRMAADDHNRMWRRWRGMRAGRDIVVCATDDRDDHFAPDCASPMIGPPMCHRCLAAAESIMLQDTIGWIGVVVSDLHSGTLIQLFYLCPTCRDHVNKELQ